MLVQFCFFTVYLVIGLPGAARIKRIGYMRGAVTGLRTMMAGCLLFIPARQTASYGAACIFLQVGAEVVIGAMIGRNRAEGGGSAYKCAPV